MNELDLIADLHLRNPRQGPGGDTETLQALQLAGLIDADSSLRVADIGCGTGAGTLLLALYTACKANNNPDVRQVAADQLVPRAQRHRLPTN